MFIWIVLMALSIFGSMWGAKRLNYILGFFILSCMCFMCAFRGSSIGVDTSQYLKIYTSPFAQENYVHEFFFYAITKLFYDSGFDAQWCQAFMAVITYVPLGWLILYRTKNACLAILIFIISVNGYFFETFNIVRQSTATIFLLWSYIYLSESKIKKAFLFIIIAIGFHTTTIVYIPLILIAYYVRFSTLLVYISLACSLVFAFLISNISLITDIITQLAALQIAGTEKYEHFVDYELDLARNLNGLITLLIPFSAFCAYAYRRYREQLLMRIFFVGVFSLNIVSIMPTSYRMAYGLISTEILLYPYIFSHKPKNIWIPCAIITALVILWLWRLSSTLDKSELTPYQFM